MLCSRTGTGKKLEQPEAGGSPALGLLSVPLRFRGEALIPDGNIGLGKPLPTALSSPASFFPGLWLSYDFPKRTAVPECKAK